MKTNLLQICTLGLLGLVGLTANANDISQDQLLVKMKSINRPIIIDVRSAEEYAEGHVPGAINIAHNIIGEQIGQLGLNKDTDIVLYCRSGYRAGKAHKVLDKLGFTNLSHLEGDHRAWKAKGLAQTIGSDP